MSTLCQEGQNPCSHGVYILVVEDKGKHGRGSYILNYKKIAFPQIIPQKKRKLPYNFAKSFKLVFMQLF